MFAKESQTLHNKRHFFISVITINMFYCTKIFCFFCEKVGSNHEFESSVKSTNDA